jgi:cell wall-associated NlpC family hydrolase
MSDELRAAVLAEAESWIGTPFQHMQRCKGAGVDCGQFLIGVFANLTLIPNIKTEYYPRDFHLHGTREWYTETLEQFCRRIEPGESPLPADIVLFRIGRVYSHGAIVTNWPTMIHAYVTRGVIWADGLQGQFMNKQYRFFRPHCLEMALGQSV